MTRRDPLDEVVRIAAAVGGPAVLLTVALSVVGASGLVGGAALSAALALLGGPGGIPAGIMVLTFTAGVSAALASYGLEAVLVAIYNKRIADSDDPNIEEVIVAEINSNRLLNPTQKREIISAVTKTFSILLVGRTGTGKSSTINSLLGKEVVPVGDVIPVTDGIQYFECKFNDAKVRLYDTPGLCDSVDRSNDDDYIRAITDVLSDIHLILFVTPLNEARVSRDERIALRSLSAAVGQKLWAHMIALFSFACSPLPGASNYEEFVEGRSQALRSFVAEVASEDIAMKLRCLPIDNASKLCPDGREWIPELFTLIVENCSSSGILPFIQVMGDDIGDVNSGIDDNNSESADTFSRSRRINLDEEQVQRVKRAAKRSVIAGTVLGTLLAAAVAPVAPVLIVGAVGGAALGFWSWLSRK